MGKSKILHKSFIWDKTSEYYNKYLIYAHKSLSIYRQRYFFRKDKVETDKTLFLIIDPSVGISYPGLADRLKAIVAACYLAQISGRKFRLICEPPFDISRYFQIGEDNCMKGSIGDLSFSLQNSRITTLNNMRRFPKLNSSVRQYHIYSFSGGNILKSNNINDWEKLWHDLSVQLFRPAQLLLDAYRATNLQPKSYNSVHLRFVNTLENFEDGHPSFLNPQQKEALINSCLNCVKRIQSSSGFPVVVFSDSKMFLERAQGEGFLVINGDIAHIKHLCDEKTLKKTILDFYAMSQSKKVFRIVSENLYSSNFSRCAAMWGGIEFESIQL